MDERKRQRERFIDKVYKLQEEYEIEIVSDNRYYYDVKTDDFFFPETEVIYPEGKSEGET